MPNRSIKGQNSSFSNFKGILYLVFEFELFKRSYILSKFIFYFFSTWSFAGIAVTAESPTGTWQFYKKIYESLLLTFFTVSEVVSCIFPTCISNPLIRT